MSAIYHRKNVRLLNMKRREFGTMGEDLAVEFLKKYGYQIVCRNFYCRFGEVDIIATDTGDQLIFLEVKTRRGNAFGPPETSVDWRKQRKIRHAAMYFLSSKVLNMEIITGLILSRWFSFCWTCKNTPPEGRVRRGIDRLFFLRYSKGRV